MRMKTKFLIGSIILICLAVGGFFVFIRVEEKKILISDAHAHLYYNNPSYIDEWIIAMDKYNVRRTVLFAPGEFDVDTQKILDAHAKYPDRTYPMLGGFDLQSEDSVNYLENQLSTGKWKGIGEIFMIRPQSKKTLANHPVMLKVYETLIKYDVPIFVHYELHEKEDLDALYEALKAYPNLKFIWCHLAGHVGDSEGLGAGELDNALAKHPNLYIQIDTMSYNAICATPSCDKLSENYLSLFEKYPDRFMVGSDIDCGVDGHFDKDLFQKVVMSHQLVLSQLTPATAKKIGYENIERLLSPIGKVTFPEMVLIPAGTFKMGGVSYAKEGEPSNSEEGTPIGPTWSKQFPVHTVSLDSFYLSKYEVTNAQFQEFVDDAGYITTAEKNNLSYTLDLTGYMEFSALGVSGMDWRHPQGPESNISGKMNHPVVCVSWDDAVHYLNWLSTKKGLTPAYSYNQDTGQWELVTTADGYRLPTEAEWEYAARGGFEDAPYPWGWNLTNIGAYANYYQRNPHQKPDPYEYTAPVGSFPATGYGLYDMAGNAAEWVSDWASGEYYQYCVDNNITKNPLGPPEGKMVFEITGEIADTKVYRGGSWLTCECWLRVTDRGFTKLDAGYNNIGFRVAKNSQQQAEKSEEEQNSFVRIGSDKLKEKPAIEPKIARHRGKEGTPVFGSDAFKAYEFLKDNPNNAFSSSDVANDMSDKPIPTRIYLTP